MQLTYAEAARWLLFINGYDDVSVKPSKAGLPSISIGWLGQNTIVCAIGRNLFETLMMNLVPLQNGNGELWPKPCPIWECLPRSDERKRLIHLLTQRNYSRTNRAGYFSSVKMGL